MRVASKCGRGLPLPGVDGGVQNCGLQLIGFTLMKIDQFQLDITVDFIRKKLHQRVVTDQGLVIGIERLMPGSVEDFDCIIPFRVIPLPKAHNVRANGLENIGQKQAGLIAGFKEIPRRTDLPFKRIFVHEIPSTCAPGGPKCRSNVRIVIKTEGRRKLKSLLCKAFFTTPPLPEEEEIES